MPGREGAGSPPPVAKVTRGMSIVPGQDPAPARLLIADDHALIREGMRAMLAREPDLEVVGEAASGREALELSGRLRPDLVLMDLRMPEMDGLEATRRIKAECPQTNVLIMTAHEDPEYLLEAIRAGAAGYVLKEATRSQVLDAVRTTLGGEPALNQRLAMRLLRRLADEEADRWQAGPSPQPAALTRRQEPLPEAPLQPLTDREREVLSCLARGKTNRQIAQELMVSLSSVKSHVHRVIAKLGASDRTQAAIRALKLGLLPPEQGE